MINMKKIFFSDATFEWLCRILFSINIILIGINNYDGVNYPTNVLIITLVALWLYFYKLKILSIMLLLFVLFINYLHLGVTSVQ